MSQTLHQDTGDSGPDECQIVNLKALVSPPLNPSDGYSPIHHLPTEILLEVVRYYIHQDTRIRDLVRLTLVCKRWSIIVQDTPILWTTINAAEGHAMVRKALQMAKDALLDLTFNVNTAQMKREVFINCIGERIGQWRSLVLIIRWPVWHLFLGDLLSVAPPNLEVLHLSARSAGGLSRDTIPVFGGNPVPRRLREISLVNIPVNLASLQLGGLRSLVITNTPMISATNILNVIRGSPTIECIRLRCLKSLSGVAPSHQVSPHPGTFGSLSVQLASLIHLSLDDIPISFLNYLLATIDAPRLEKLEIACVLSDASSARLLLEGLRHQLPTLARLTTDAQNFKFVLSSYASYQIVIAGLDLTLRMRDLRPDVLKKPLNRICNHLGRSLNDLPAHLEVADCEPAIPSRLKWLTRHLTVTKLKLHSDPRYGTALDPIIPFFSRPTTSTPVSWLLPQVEVIETNLVLRNGNDSLVEMIRNRHSAEDGKDGVAAPKPFREIWLAFGGKLGFDSPDPVNMEFLKEVQTVANGADVYWKKKKLA